MSSQFPHEQEAWKTASARAAGEKVYDDPKLLKKSLKKVRWILLSENMYFGVLASVRPANVLLLTHFPLRAQSPNRRPS